MNNNEYYLMGNLNCDMIATRYDNDTCKLMSITDVYGLQQLITEPTRVTPTSSTLIDVIYTNCLDKLFAQESAQESAMSVLRDRAPIT